MIYIGSIFQGLGLLYFLIFSVGAGKWGYVR